MRQPASPTGPPSPAADDDAARPRSGRARADEIGGGTTDPPRWQVVEDVIAGTVTVSTHDGGTRPADGALYSAET
jgi:hypothetical protein